MPYAGPNLIVQFVLSHVEAVFINILIIIIIKQKFLLFSHQVKMQRWKNSFTPFNVH